MSEIEALELYSTQKIVKTLSFSEGANVLPSTWAFKVRCYQDSHYRKTKGNSVLEGTGMLIVLEALVMSRLTVRLLLCLKHKSWLEDKRC